ncbi:MAG TPA: lytic murein transglycosylase B [Gammaproteobacteria bacterium]|nr:lytic murein transglycosylase B [Gammaproteobacteria bacterium]
MSAVACAEETPPAAIEPFIHELVREYGFDATSLRTFFHDTQRLPDILEAIAKPAEVKPWYEYRALLLTPERVQEGAVFWRLHADELARAQARYGVDAGIIVAILGVETFYGRHAGRYRVADALYTLAFYYPPRADFFRGELKNYLLLTRERHLDALSLYGSYAGAMGMPQFMPSSTRAYAVDFDGDGRADIWSSAADAIGSVANYLHEHGWRTGQLIAIPAQTDGQTGNENYQKLLAAGLKPSLSVETLAQQGIRPASALPAETKAALLQFAVQNGSEYWLGLDNFYAITRYNQSPLYALVVVQLAAAIREACHVPGAAKCGEQGEAIQ